MKSIKHLDIKNNKVLLGLFSLLFLLVTAQTAAIIKTQNSLGFQNQSAQLLTAVNCLSVGHKYNTSEPFLLAPDQYLIKVYVSITNNCGYNINIINPAGLHFQNPITNLKTGVVEILGQNNEPVTIPNLTSPEYSINTIAELLSCTLCEQSATSVNVSPAGRNGVLESISLANGQTRTMGYVFYAEVPSNPSYMFRVRPTQLKLFRSSALSDQIIQSSEIQTRTLGRSETSQLATDFLRIANPLSPGLTEEDSKSLINIDQKYLNTKVE